MEKLEEVSLYTNHMFCCMTRMDICHVKTISKVKHVFTVQFMLLIINIVVFEICIKHPIVSDTYTAFCCEAVFWNAL